MRLGRRLGGRKPEVTMAPLIDVIFLLLIFYAVTTQFVTDQRLRLKLPEARTAENVGRGAEKRPPVITVAADGSVWVDQRRVPEGELEREIARIVERAPERTVILKGDRQADYGVVVRVLDLARAAGATTIQMSAVRPAEGGG